MTGIIDYGAGNIRSVRNALDAIGAPSVVSRDIAELARADRLILPGVGSAGSAMSSLRNCGLEAWLGETRLPLLGICLGMQLLYEQSDEDRARCLELLPGSVEGFDGTAVKVPHVGWNQVEVTTCDRLFERIAQREYFYFVHSYRAPVDATTVAITEYGAPFAAAVARGNYRGVQFHPEKSGAVGLALLRNFVEGFGPESR